LDIYFGSNQLRKVCNDKRRLAHRYGTEDAGVISRRLDDLNAANTLEDFRNLPGRLHELTGDKAGQLTLDLRGPKRLVLVPAHDPPPRKKDGGLDWAQVTAVEIVGIEDTHD
jgi:proteic killer suppression protein